LIKNIRIENFMAHQDTSIELSPGVTVITGPNNIGKSAVVEAIRYLVYNPAPKNVIRHGAKRAVVRLELDSGEIITWQRQDKNASYTIEQNGQESEHYHKFGRDVPEDVRSLLRLEQVDTDTGRLDIHLGNQREPIFLLDRPGSHAAGFFAASTEADYLLKMQQALKGRIDQANRDKKRLALELSDIAQQLNRYEPLDDLDVQISQAEKSYAAILATERQLPLLADLISQLLENIVQLNLEKKTGAVLGELTNSPVLQDPAGLTLLLSEMADKTRQHGREEARSVELAPLTSPPVLTATPELEAWLTQSRFLQIRLIAAQSHSQVLAALSPPETLTELVPLQDLVATYGESLARSAGLRQRQAILARQAEPLPLEDTSSLEDLIRQLHREQARQEHLLRFSRFLAQLPAVPDLVGLHDLEESYSALRQAAIDLSHQQAQLASLKVRLETKQAEIQSYLQDAGLCPLCGSPLDLGHFLESWHG
jgi:DNA repair exonuclease SbcCD ATPase subunit